MFRVIYVYRDERLEPVASYHDTALEAYRETTPHDLSRVHLKMFNRVREELALAGVAVLIWYDDDRAAYLQELTTGEEMLPPSLTVPPAHR